MSEPSQSKSLHAWLQRQSPEVQQAIRASVDFETDTVRDAGPGEPASGAVDCLHCFAELNRPLPSGRYFKIAHDLRDKAGALAFEIGIRHCATEGRLETFRSLAGTALFGDSAGIARFEKNFRADAALDDVVLYFQAELEMLDGGFPAD